MTPFYQYPGRQVITLGMALFAWVLPMASAQTFQTPDEITFTLFSDGGATEVRQLSEFQGKIVVLYYFSPW